MAGQPLPKGINKGAKDRPCVVVGEGITQARWDEIFGKKDKPTEKGVFALVNGKFVRVEEAPYNPTAPAIHDDHVYTKQWDYGAGRKWNSRTERREWMKRRGVVEAG